MAAMLVLVLAALVSAGFFVGLWGRNAELLGAHDLGWALVLSFAVPIAFYGSLCVGGGALIGVIVSLWVGSRSSTRLFVAALAASLCPLAYVLIVDMLAR